MTAHLHLAAAPLAEFFRSVGYTPSGLESLLGAAALAALHRGDPASVSFALRENHTPQAQAVRVFALHQGVTPEELVALVGATLAATLQETGVLAAATNAGASAELLYAQFDIRPHKIAGKDHWVFSDRDASIIYQHVPSSDHVLGVGAASLSLLSVTPTSPVSSVLDLGTGSGVQVLGQLGCAEQIVATDVHPRALDLARATLAASASGTDITLAEGSWFEPVAGRRFGRIIANPPFVVGLGQVDHVYRDSGLDLDGATALVTSQSPEHLELGATAFLLGSWVHTASERAQARIASWLPSHGVRAWVLQRDIADPALYVHTWLRDESIDPRSPEGQLRATAWLEHFARREVESIGFGFIFLHKVDEDTPSELVFEEFNQQFSGSLGQEVEEYFTRAQWLSEQTPEDLLAARYQVRPGLALEEVSVPDDAAGQGFRNVVRRLTRTEGPRWTHEIDEAVQTIVQGLHPQGLGLEEIGALYALSQGLNEEESDGLVSELPRLIADLVRHGLVIPAELLK
ncbi:DUF7782 domain-containing protein [Corynebacterium kozikiae]|uniref:DUF7782 domain-containing protein n=1 Tax=Corynebacterium kozikiae TaxID=2968469 RepID=UPI00211BB0D7|nr:methyltransferase [Corynebacterium sp. 76QC2CO]